MRKKLIKPGSESGYIGDKPKPKPIKKVYDLSGIDNYRKRRDLLWLTDLFIEEQTKKEIREIWHL